MKTRLAITFSCVLAAVAPSHGAAQSSTYSDIQNAVTQGDTNITLRYRYERVDQDNIDKAANASTLLTRFKYETSPVNGFFAVFEADNVTAIGNENYNSTVNTQTQYPVVADPTGTEINQAYVGFKYDALLVTAGRQRINHNDQRFIGSVAWRQNEQTYDGYRVQYTPTTKLNFDYGYLHNVNRIFGTTSEKSDLQGALHLVNLSYHFSASHTLTGFIYSFDFDRASAISTKTVGANYDGKLGPVNIHAAYAKQSDNADNPTDFSANYYAFDINTVIKTTKVGAGVEVMGSDNDVGFTTPLATLHKFQGFTDKFLNTPNQGIVDRYINVSDKIVKLTLTAVYHDFQSESGNIDYGRELNFVAKYPLASKTGLLLKYAKYSADEFSVDTNKFWLMLTAKY